MSRSVDLFIDSPLAVAELGKCLAELTRGSCRPGPQSGFMELRAGAVTATLGRHHYVDDGALRLSRYRYALSTRFRADESLNDCPEVVFVRHLAELVRQRMGTAALVVLDLELRDPGPGSNTRSARPGSTPEAARPGPATEAEGVLDEPENLDERETLEERKTGEEAKAGKKARSTVVRIADRAGDGGTRR